MHRQNPKARGCTQNEMTTLLNKERQMRQRELRQQTPDRPFINLNDRTRNATLNGAPYAKARETVRFDDCQPKNGAPRRQSRKGFANYEPKEATVPEFYSSHEEDEAAEVHNVYSNHVYDHDNESETESVFDPDDYTRQTLYDMETKMNAMTNRFVYRVKSEVDETFSKLQLQQKLKEKKTKKSAKPRDERAKMPERGAGDTVKDKLCSDDTFHLLQKKKMQAYSIIDQNIKVLQQVDQLTGQLYKNHLSNLKKKD